MHFLFELLFVQCCVLCLLFCVHLNCPSTHFPTMSLSTIPSLCLLTILDRIPLHDLLSTVNLVCNRWAQLQPVACHRRRSLFLYDNHDYLDYLRQVFSYDLDVMCKVIKDDGTPFDGWFYVQYQLGQNGLRLALKVGAQNRVLEQLVTLLPNISRLQLGQSVTYWPTVIGAVNRLLEKWSTKLVHLNLWLFNESRAYDTSPGLIVPLFDRLNQLTSLNRLTIMLYLPYGGNISEMEHKSKLKLTPVLSRVEHFGYGGNYDDQLFEGYILADLETVLKDQSSSQLKTIIMRPNIKMEDAASRYSRCFTSKLTNFTVFPEYDGLSDLVISRLGSIECLYVKGNPKVDISFPDFIGKLSHLSRLTFLAFENFPKWFFNNLNHSQPLPQIGSLKELKIQIECALSHHCITQLSIPSLFPSIQVIKLHQMVYVDSFVACTECNLKNILPVIGEPWHIEAKLGKCSRQTLESLNNCHNQTCVINFVRSASPSFHRGYYNVFDATYTPGQI